MFSIFFALEAGARQLILPEMVSHFCCCVPVATGCSELHEIFLCFRLALDQDNHNVLPKHHLCSYIRFLRLVFSRFFDIRENLGNAKEKRIFVFAPVH